MVHLWMICLPDVWNLETATILSQDNSSHNLITKAFTYVGCVGRFCLGLVAVCVG